MTQSSEIFELLQLLQKSGGEAVAGQERRRHARTAARGHVAAVLEVPGLVPLAVSIRDMSRSGMGLYAPNPLAVGLAVAVSFRVASANVQALCRVANCREDVGGDRYIVGLAFTSVRRLPGPGGAGVEVSGTAGKPTPSGAATAGDAHGGGVCDEPTERLPGMAGGGSSVGEGQIVSALETVAGAEMGHVDEVARRLSRLVRSD